MTRWSYGASVHFSVLGPLRVIGDDGEPIEIRGAKERTLLAHLVAHAGQTVPVADLVDGLWGEAPPRTAAKSLQTYVLRVRNALEPGRGSAPSLVVTEGGGYRLAVVERDIDAGQFAALVELGRRTLIEGRAEAAVDALSEALALWRGPAYSGFEHTDFGRAEGRRLEELRLSALEERCAAQLEQGRAAAVAPELERLVAQHPLRERLWALLVLALYRTGRQGDALGAYERARGVLDEELGVDPGPELKALHARVLAQDPHLDQPVRRTRLPAGLVSTAGALVGRDEELQLLREAWSRACAGEGLHAVVRGPRGAGSSRLVAALAEEVARDGADVLMAGDPGLDGRPALVVADHVEAPATSRGQLVVSLVGADAHPPPGAVVVDLRPLRGEDVRAVVADYVASSDVETATDVVLAESGGWPARVHESAARVAREAAVRRVEHAAAVTGASSATLTAARSDLTDGVEALQEAARASTAADPDLCPWKGLASYEEEDAAWFAGRERLVAELVSRLADRRLLGVVGASGSGKSSAVRAGLLAAVAQGALPGSAGWTRLVMRPGSHPMQEVARQALGMRRSMVVGELLEHLLRTEDAGAERVVLVVDQLEEVWTACHDDGERLAFLDLLAELTTDPRSPITVVAALRADFLERLAEHQALTELMRDGTVLVGPPTPAEIRRAVERPAARAHLRLDEGLADTIVSDSGSEPGLLPLLSTALTRLWERREGRDLTYAGYVGLGGISGAISDLAEGVYRALDAEAQDAARMVLLRLTGPGDGVSVVRRRVPASEIEELTHPGVPAAVAALVEGRLLTSGDGHLEVAHEALYREWPRLGSWLQEDAAGRSVQRRLAVAAGEWDSEQRDPALLWSGARLSAAVEVADLRPEEITATESAFLEAGVRAVEEERRTAEERASATMRQNRRLRLLLLGTAGLLLLALVAGLLALRARAAAEESAAQAEASAVSAEARRLAADALNEDRPAVGLLEAVEATRREPSPETYGALLTLLTRTPEIATRFRIPDRFLRIGAAMDRSVIYLADNTDLLRAVDAVTGEERWRATTSSGAQWGAPVSGPDDRWVAAPVLGEPGSEVLAFLDPETGEVLRTTSGAALARAASGPPHWLDENAHTLGRRVVVSSGSHVFLVDAAGRVRRSLPFGPHLPYTTLLPDGRLAAQVDDTSTRVIDLRTGRQQVRDGSIVGVSADGDRIVTSAVSASTTGTDVSSLRLRDARWRPVARPVRVEGYVREVEFLPRDEVAVALDEVVQVHRASTLRLERTLAGHSGAVLGVQLAGPDGDLLWSAGRDGTAVAFDLSGRRGVLRTLPQRFQVDAGTAAGGTGLMVEHYEDRLNTVRMVDLTTGRDLHGELTIPGCLCQPTTVALSPDGGTAVIGVVEFTEGFADVVTDRGRAVVWDVESGRRIRTITTPWEATGVAVTPDGRDVIVNGNGGWGRWDLGSGEQVWAVEDPTPDEEPLGFGGVAGLSGVSPDGRYVGLVRNEEVLLLDAADGDVLRSTRLPGAGSLSDVVWADDGATVVLGSLSGRLYFLDGATLEHVAPQRLVTAGFVLDLALSPDGSMLAVMGTDGDVTLFDTATWRPYGKPVVDNLGWGFLAFGDGTLQIRGELGPDHEIDLDPDSWVTSGCRIANTRFTEEESAVILPGEPVRPTCA